MIPDGPSADWNMMEYAWPAESPCFSLMESSLRHAPTSSARFIPQNKLGVSPYFLLEGHLALAWSPGSVPASGKRRLGEEAQILVSGVGERMNRSWLYMYLYIHENFIAFSASGCPMPSSLHVPSGGIRSPDRRLPTEPVYCNWVVTLHFAGLRHLWILWHLNLMAHFCWPFRCASQNPRLTKTTSATTFVNCSAPPVGPESRCADLQPSWLLHPRWLCVASSLASVGVR